MQASSRRVGAFARFATAIAPLLCVIALAPRGFADANDDFLAAEAALERGKLEEADRLIVELDAHPLLPYLTYARLTRDLDETTPDAIAAFLERYASTPLAARLRAAWLERLLERGDWSGYARFYAPDDALDKRCNYLNALIQTGREADAFASVEPIWLSGRSLPPACDPVFAAWKNSGGLTSELAWGRVERAMAAGAIDLAGYIAREHMPADEARLVERWLTIHTNPQRAFDPAALPGDDARSGRIVVHAVERLAQSAPDRAAMLWRDARRRFTISPELADDAHAAIGFALAERGERTGLVYLSRIDPERSGRNRLERRLRFALTLGDWARVAAWVEALPDDAYKAERWLYWQARAQEVLGKAAEAAVDYRRAGDERSLWGFAAAERAGMPYKFDHHPTPASTAAIARLLERPAWRRIASLESLGRPLDVRREWHHLRARLEGEDIMAAALIAQDLGWRDQAIFTLARSGYWDDLELRFPTPYRRIVARQANATGLDESFLYAIMRQESAFAPSVRSSAGARGLMQLMPQTARDVARLIGIRSGSLDDPEYNIALGARYLSDMLARFDGNPALAAAAYNAGPARVLSWIPDAAMAGERWIETIPFVETRAYVRRVLAYRILYDHRLGREPTPPSRLLPTVEPNAGTR